jgi:hypothetical protein
MEGITTESSLYGRDNKREDCMEGITTKREDCIVWKG